MCFEEKLRISVQHFQKSNVPTRAGVGGGGGAKMVKDESRCTKPHTVV